MKKFRIKLLLPLVLSEFYWIATYILYRYGMVKYPFAKDNVLLVFLALCNLLFCFGYLVILKIKSFSDRKKLEVNKRNIEKMLTICIIVSIVTAIPCSIRNTGNWYPPIVTNLMDPGAAYHRAVSGIMEDEGLGAMKIFAFFEIFPFMVFPLVFGAWEIISKKLRITGCIVSFYHLLIYCAGGRNMPCFLFAFSTIVTYLSKMCFVAKKPKSTIIRDSFICIFAIILIVTMFTINLKSRNLYSANIEEQLAYITHEPKEELKYLNDNSDNNSNSSSSKNDVTTTTVHISQDMPEGVYLQYKDLVITEEQRKNCETIGNIFPMYTNPYTKEYVDPENFLYNLIPTPLKFTCVTGNMYVSDSYHFLAVALRMDHKWTYGMGFSKFLQSYMKMLTGIDVEALTYGRRVVNLTSPSIVSTYGWETVYTQLANDLTFPGVIIFFGLLGAMICYLWMDIVENSNIYGIPFCIQMALLIVFVPANCITFNSGGYFVTFWGTAFVWGISIMKRKRENL